ncbi:MAG: ThuA domain-containing protein [Treponema sp.]|nr:ThuA domain-containing protein [Treponema sp.]
MSKTLKVAVLVEEHPYNIMEFQHMLDSFADCKCYVQPLDLFAQDRENRPAYDTVLWYNIHWNAPDKGAVKKYLEEEMGHSPQGIVLIHHALLNYQNWEIWDKICGFKDRGANREFKYHQNEEVKVQVLPVDHPITGGVKDFSLIDETYEIGEPEDPENTLLLSTDNPKSMKTLAWTRQYKQSRVFCFASGHDERAYGDENFRLLVHRGLTWSAGKD